MRAYMFIIEKVESFITLSTNDEYSIGALVLGHSLRQTATNKLLTILITEGVTHEYRQLLNRVYDRVIVVQALQSGDEANLRLLGRPNLGITFTKLHCWKLIEFTKAVFLDADTIVLQNIDDLFEREEFSAAPDTSWPDIFNSGVFVLRPSFKTFADLSQLALVKGSFDGGDQGLLNEYFCGWSTETLDKHLPFTYNCTFWMSLNNDSVFYTRPPALKKFGGQVKVGHFIGPEKPWKHKVLENPDAVFAAIERLNNSDTVHTTAAMTDVLAYWWAIFFQRVRPQLGYGMFLSTTFEPIPPPSQHVDAAFHSQEQNSIWFEDQTFHPEFHDTSFSNLHIGQRIDVARQFEEYHRYNEPPSCPPEKPHPTYPHHHKETSHMEHHKECHHEEQHQTQGGYQRNEEHQKYEKQMNIEVNNQNIHQSVWDQQQPRQESPVQHQSIPEMDRHFSPPQAHAATPSPPCPRPLPSQPPPSPPSPSPSLLETRNDKDPLFFAPKPMCGECLNELQWSRQFIDGLHQDFRSPILPVAPLGPQSRVKRRSVQPWPVKSHPVAFIQQSTQPSVSVDEPIKTHSTWSKKKGGEDGLHQIQKCKSKKKRQQRVPIDRKKLINTAKRTLESPLENSMPLSRESASTDGHVGEVSIPKIEGQAAHVRSPQDLTSETLDRKPKAATQTKANEPTKKVEYNPDCQINQHPWIPRLTHSQSLPKNITSTNRYVCDRHRPLPSPPRWRMHAWERGEIDYTGHDRFCNILARIRSTIQQFDDSTMPIGIWL